jgi:hypothetical protein
VLAYDDPWIVRGLIISGLALAVWLAACAAAGRRASPLVMPHANTPKERPQ